MKWFIISVLLTCLLTCSGCDNLSEQSQEHQESKEAQESQAPPGTALIHISPRQIKRDSDQNCNEPEFCNQVHCYELYIDRKLVYRSRLRDVNEDDDSTKWQLTLGQHQLRVSADGFNSFDKPIEVLEKTKYSSIQRFEMILHWDKQAKDKKAGGP
ncbi:MAG: hypothetical protein SD837_01750 [Candidatus Electrothrix scaldis]|nr:MAG: hypothetical protein SD837_01750 [Candidatus Electrothrix sp. GW3-3]